MSNRRQARHTARTAHRRTLPRINVRSRASTYAPAHRGVPSTMATDDGEVVTPRLRARPGAGARVPRGTTSGTWLPRAAALREEVPTAHPLPPSTRHSGGKQVGAGDYVDPLRAARPSRAASTRERGAYGRAVLGVAALLIAMAVVWLTAPPVVVPGAVGASDDLATETAEGVVVSTVLNPPGAPGGSRHQVRVTVGPHAGTTATVTLQAPSIPMRVGTAPTYEPGDRVVLSYRAEDPASDGMPTDRKSTRLNSSHTDISRMPSSA